MVSLTEKREAEKARLAQMPPSEDDPSPDVSGILLSDQITYFARSHFLISPFNPKNLKPAGYELTVGDEYFLSGEFLPLTGRITIPPFEVAVIKTGEVLRLPRYMIARWNIRVKHAYSGLLWVGGPQVDPGYVGHLFCPIYNLSDKPVNLNFGDALALMDFQKTTVYDKEKRNELVTYTFPPQRVILEDYDIEDLKSALFTRAGKKLDEFDDSIKSLESRFVTFTQISFAIFALVIGLLALSSKSSSEAVLLSASWVGAATVSMSVSAILIAIFSYLQWRLVRLVGDRYGTVMANRAREAQKFLRTKWWSSIFATVIVALGVGVIVFFIIDPKFTAIRRQHIITQTDLEENNAQVSKSLNATTERFDRIEAKTDVARREMETLKAELEKLRARASDVDGAK